MLASGQTLTHYRVVEKIGAGGMGEVYKARDTQLDRDVALKVLLPEAFGDPERLRRFIQEARAASSLDHPNIAVVHEFAEHEGVHFIVMQFFKGATLRERIGRMKLPDALGFAIQMANALSTAHAQGIIHRDLKPENVLVTEQGVVKILDFGVAKLIEPLDLEDAPTRQQESPLTGSQYVVGTAAYMSPEQADGRKVDARSDVFSFGSVLYEMVTGRRAFEGTGFPAIVAAVLRDEPAPLRKWLPEAPLELQRILARALRKDPERRFQSMGELRIALEDLRSEVDTGVAVPAMDRAGPQPRRSRVWAIGAAVLATAALAALVAWILRPLSDSSSAALRAVLPLTPAEALAGLDFPSMAFSPDGRSLVYVVRQDRQRLHLRALSEHEGVPIPGTEGAKSPFFSPSGEWIGFFAGGKLKKVSARGGAPIELCNAANPHGASWGSDDHIVFAPIAYGGLFEVSSSGGTPRAVTTLDAGSGERAHRWPDVLPGAKSMLFTAWRQSGPEGGQIILQQSGERRILIQGGTSGRHAPSGHIVYARAGTLMAAPFDSERLVVTGPAVPMVDGVSESAIGASQFDFSRLGWLVYAPGTVASSERTLVLVDRSGESEPLPLPPGPYSSPRYSPDGDRLALEAVDPKNDVYLYDFEDGTMNRLTFASTNTFPVWTPDGRQVAFQSNQAGPFNLYWKPADGSGRDERLTTSAHVQNPFGFSPDGKLLAYHEVHPDTGRDLWTVPVFGERTPILFLSTNANEGTPAFSPDGRFIAYTSDESGRMEVYVRPFPAEGDRRWQISTEGGSQPVWSRSGKELFFLRDHQMMAVPISAEGKFVHGEPILLFEGNFDKPSDRPNFDVTPDDKGFIMVKLNEPEASATQLNLVLDWFGELERRVPPQ
jgi:eukaryotic-like serine/threonine-protein kinase